MDITKHILGLEGPDDEVNAFIARIKKGDPRCSLKVGDRVVKVLKLEAEELNPIGAKGTVVGSMYMDDPKSQDKEAYWVKWDHHPIVSTTLGRRLNKLLES